MQLRGVKINVASTNLVTGTKVFTMAVVLRFLCTYTLQLHFRVVIVLLSTQSHMLAFCDLIHRLKIYLHI